MQTSPIYLYTALFVSIFCLVISGVITAAFIIPLQYKQARVKNGLALLRKQMLAKGILSLVVIVIAVFCLTARFYISDIEVRQYMVSTAILFFSLGILSRAIIDYKVYHQQYTTHNKKIHEKIARLEKSDK